MRRITLAILTISSFLMASDNSYISNKKYTYDEVTEILSDKIIENRKKIDELRTHSYKEDSEVKKEPFPLDYEMNIQCHKFGNLRRIKMNMRKLSQKLDNKFVREILIKLIILYNFIIELIRIFLSFTIG